MACFLEATFQLFQNRIFNCWHLQKLRKVEINSLRVGDIDIIPVKSVRNLWAWFDENMSMDVHVGKVCGKKRLEVYIK